MGHMNDTITGDPAREVSTLPESDPTNPELIKVLRAEEILAETPQSTNADTSYARGVPAATGEPVRSAPSPSTN